VEEFREIANIKIVIFPLAALFAVTRSVVNLMKVKETGSVGRYSDRMMSFDEFRNFVGISGVYETEQRYLGTHGAALDRHEFSRKSHLTGDTVPRAPCRAHRRRSYGYPQNRSEQRVAFF
jgi:hypothetical protein